MYKKPENLKDMLELQKVLDENINETRPRTIDDIKLSMIAEIIEFNEETIHSHKTWKTKPYDKEKELEELLDVWFFMCQLINMEKNKDGFDFNWVLKQFDERFDSKSTTKELNLIRTISGDDFSYFSMLDIIDLTNMRVWGENK